MSSVPWFPLRRPGPFRFNTHRLPRLWVGVWLACMALGAQTPSPEQRAWILAHPVIRVAYDPSYPPVEFEGANGEPAGLGPDHLRWVAEHMGLKLVRVPAKSWEEALTLVRERRADVLTDTTPLPERRSYLAFTRAWMELPDVIITRKDHPWIGDLTSLAGHRVAAVKGYSSRDFLMAHQPAAQLLDVPDIESALKEVSFGTVDAAVSDLASASWMIDQRGITNLRVSGGLGSPTAVTLACRSDWPELRGILDDGLAAMPPETRQALRQKWVTLTSIGWKPSPRFLTILAVASALVLAALVLAWNLLLRARVKAAMEKVRGQTEKLEDLNRQQMELMGILSHDLRNPVSGIALAAELLQNEESLEEVHVTAKKIKRATDSLVSLLDQFLHLQSYESGRMQVLLEPVVARALIQEAIDAFAPQALQKGQQLDLEGSAGLCLMADPLLLREVIDNLVSNALKYSPLGARIDIRVRENHPRVRIEVIDQGPGLSEEDRQRLFQRFARLSARPTGGETSVGLGLSIAKKIVEAMGGCIGADGTPNRGATFWLELPKADADTQMPNAG